MKLLLIFILATLFLKSSENDYIDYYPVSIDQANFRYITSYVSQETILFEANPILRKSLYNDFKKTFTRTDKKIYNTGKSFYVSFRPQIRMYTDESLPVKTPSYRILLGNQWLRQISRTPKDLEQKPIYYIGFSVESGHYSNGQNGSAFSEKFIDGSVEGNNIYKSINDDTDLSKILNRNSGNFSTNMTELIFNFRRNTFEDQITKSSNSIDLGYIVFHDNIFGLINIGGYTQNDIKIYGKHRFIFKYNYLNNFKLDYLKFNGRFELSQRFDFISKPHESVNPLRSESTISVFPHFKNGNKSIGYSISMIYGHDNYNYRFVDSGLQFSFGITFSNFPPIKMFTPQAD